MGGWQIVWAAAFVKLFGFSFTLVRWTTLLVAMGTAFLLQRTFVRSGVGEWNAVLGTLTVVLSPLFIPLSLSFMTDVYGFFVIVLCFYCCLRALQAQTLNAMVGWICFAALSNGIGGTARQIAWLGTLVMIPSTLWLLRDRRKVLLFGIPCVAVSAVFLLGAMHWLKQQPYSMPESLFSVRIGFHQLAHLARQFARVGVEFPLFLLPVLLAFSFALRGRLRWLTVVGVSVLLLLALMGKPLLHGEVSTQHLEPTMGNYVTQHGVVDGTPIQGERPVALTPGVRAGLTFLTVFAVFSLIAVVRVARQRTVKMVEETGTISSRDLCVVLLPFTLAYVGLLAPRASFDTVWDRYLLALLMVALVFLLRFYQREVGLRLPLASVVVLVCVTGYGVAATHDMFAMYRGRIAEIEVLQAAGIPSSAIDGGFEYNGWAQLMATGHINSPEIVNPRGTFSPTAFDPPLDNCHPEIPYLFPQLVPRYALSFDPGLCGGEAGFAPVVYETWLAPHRTAIYTIRYAVR
jgi:hypothetical protein